MPPDASEDLLIEDGSVCAQEAPLVGPVAHVPGLTSGLLVSVVTVHAVLAGEGGLGDRGEDGVVDAGLACQTQ